LEPSHFDDQEQSMSDASSLAKNLRERLGVNAEDRLGKALSDLLESPLLTGALGRAFDAREKAAQAQEVAMGALNIPSAADIERLTRRLRSVSYRLEGIEDGVGRLDRVLASGAVQARLSAIEDRLQALGQKIDQSVKAPGKATRTGKPAPRKATGSGKPASAKAPSRAKPTSAKAPRGAKPTSAKAPRRAKPTSAKAARKRT
jgi:hypothetical protein